MTSDNCISLILNGYVLAQSFECDYMAAPIGTMPSKVIEKEPSPWLYWSIAIAIGVMGIGGAIGASVGLFFGVNNWT